MAKETHYSESEMTPDLLKLNLQYFFNKAHREFKRKVDEIVISTNCDEERWLKLVYNFFDYVENPPQQQNPKLHDLAEHLCALATEDNMNSVLGVLKSFSNMAASDLKKVDHKSATVFVDNMSELVEAIFSKEATFEKERAEKEMEEKLEESKNKSSITEADKELVKELKQQIMDLSKIVDELDSESKQVDDAKKRIDEAKDNAIRIANLMENEVRKQRENEELRIQEELIRRSDEREEFNRVWRNYKAKYTKNDEKPTPDLFKKFLVDIKGLTLEQIDRIKVSAIFYDDDIGNFIEFDEELQRVKK